MDEGFCIIEMLFDENEKPIDYIFVETNPAFEKGTGLKNVVGKRIRELAPENEEYWYEIYGKVALTGESVRFENRAEALHRWYEVYAYRVGQPESRNVAILFNDITERKRMEEELKQSEKQYITLGDTTPYGVWLTDATGYCTYVSTSFLEMVGMSMEQVQKFGWLHLLPPEDVQPTTDHWLRCAQTGENFEREHRFRTKDGSYRNVLAIGRPIKNDEGKITDWVGLNLDITKRKQEEQRIRRYNYVLEGLNRIFSNAVQTKTEKELANACLSVALEVTGSQIGFFNLVGTDGLLREIAINYMGGGQCLMYDKIGHRLPQENISVNGLYGSVINSEKSFFTNDPLSHPDSTGQLYGHPPIKSFLGVPLISEGKTMGMIAVADREGGYSCEQEEDLEAIAPAVMQALQRKRSEEALLEAYEKNRVYSEELHTSNEELQTQSEELQKANEALLESEERFRTLTENSPDVIIRFDRQNRHIYANPAAAEVYGLSQEEIIGKTHSELGRDPEQIKFWERHHEKVFIIGKSDEMEFQYLSPQGKEYYFNTRIVPEFFNGKVGSVLSISRDIKDIKEAEVKLKEILSNLEEKIKERTSELEEAYDSLLENEIRLNEAQKIAHIGSWDRNLVTGELYWSDEMYRIFRLDPIEFDATYDAFLDYVHPDDRDYVYNSLQKALNGDPINIDYRIILADREERIVHAQGEAIFDEKNIPIRTRGTIQDITESKKVEEALAKIEIARKQEIHHRIKNNLQVISSLLDLQAEKFYNREDIKDSEVLEAFKESQDRVISMALIHEELYKGGGIDTLDFSSYIEELAENLFLTYRLRDTDISLNMDLEENIFFDMDTAVPLGMIVNELVSNFLKHAFIGRDKGEIRIKLYREESPELESSRAVINNEDFQSTGFTLAVSDNGVGIPENLEIEDLDSLGFQLVTSLVDQLGVGTK